MRQVTARIIAVALLVIPGWAATYGFLLIKDALFDFFSLLGNEEEEAKMAWGMLFGGMALFLAGTGFIGGWVFFRDRKRNYVAPRFREKRKPKQS